MPITHRFASAYADGSDPTLVKPSNWNDTHITNLGITSVSTNTTLTNSAELVLATAGVSGITVTLPTSVSNSGLVIRIKRIDNAAGIVTIATTSSQTIDGLTNYFLVNQYQFVFLVSDGANWLIVGNN
jgi:hypothetical protein